MANAERPQRQHRPYLTIVAIGLMLVVGAVIIFLDRNQVRQLAGKAEWGNLGIALALIAASYFFVSASTVVIWEVFRIQLNRRYLMRLGFVSAVLSNLIALPAALGLQLLVLARHGVSQSQIVASSLLHSYFKNLVFYALIPLSLIYVIFTYPLVFGGVVGMILIIVILVAVIAALTAIVFSVVFRVFLFRILARVWHFVTRRHIEEALNKFSTALSQGLAELKRKPNSSFWLGGLILGDVVTMIAALWFCFKALAVPVHLGVLITGFNFGITLTVISFIPGDIGVQEASVAGIFALFGVPFSQGVLVAILFRVIYYFVPFVVSLVFYWSLLKEARRPVK